MKQSMGQTVRAAEVRALQNRSHHLPRVIAGPCEEKD